MTPAEELLVAVGRALREGGYAFVTVTPETHRRVNGRAGASVARSVRDVFGWSRPFREDVLPPALRALLGPLREAALVDDLDGDTHRSRFRFSTLGGGLYAHSAYPTDTADAVFFGPDTYRFCAFAMRVVERAERVVDIGCGSGAGGLALADRSSRIVLADVNARALSFARVNAALAGVSDRVESVESDVLAAVVGPVDLVIANPPYLVDPDHRTYRDGGAALGTALGLRIIEESLARLSPGGRLVLYTGAPVVDGEDQLLRGATPLLARAAARFRYEELDPDVFGEELETRAYAAVDRVAAVGLCAERP